jgi:hypothetical protein
VATEKKKTLIDLMELENQNTLVDQHLSSAGAATTASPVNNKHIPPYTPVEAHKTPVVPPGTIPLGCAAAFTDPGFEIELVMSAYLTQFSTNGLSVTSLMELACPIYPSYHMNLLGQLERLHHRSTTVAETPARIWFTAGSYSFKKT